MAALSQYMENPHWQAMYNHAVKPVNGGHYQRWVQGSVGMNDPMPIYSNEYSDLYMKHGQTDVLSYRGNLKHFAPGVSEDLKRQVNKCSSDTVNPAGCQTAAVRHVYSHDASPRRISYPSQRFAHHPVTPHPFDVSYDTGYSPKAVYIPPNVDYTY